MTAASERCSSRIVVSGASISAAGRLLSTADTSTGIVVCCSTFCVCEPSISPLMPRRPCEAMKIRSQPRASAACRIASCGRSLVIDGGVVGNAGHPRDHFGLGQDRPRLAGHVLVERRGRHHALERADARRAVVRLRVEERHLRAERLGERDGLVNGVDRERRIVERDQQMAIHQMTPVISTACRR